MPGNVLQYSRLDEIQFFKRGKTRDVYDLGDNLLIFATDRISCFDIVLPTPDSSRFWPKDEYISGRSQVSFDKQFVRDYLETIDWDKTHPGPKLPESIVRKTTAKYLEALKILIGEHQ